MRRRTLLHAASALAAAPLPLPLARPALAQPASTLVYVPYADVASPDPTWSSTYATRNSALAVYDTLWGTDAALNPQPQMLAGFTTEADGLVWRLALREGLLFHDNTPVLARDCVASIRRWAKRDAFGQPLLDATEALTAPDDRTILFRLKRPFPLLPQALGRASSLVPAMMPERLALTDAYVQLPEIIGSGPFRLVAEERIPGARVVYAKHSGYRPRAEGTPSFTAGPRLALVDRVVFNVMPDAAAAAAALQSGEVDWIEQPLIDLLPLLRRSRDIAVEVKDPTGYLAQLRFNHLHPPFDNAAIRRVVLAVANQADCMTAVAGSDRSIWRDGVGIFAPGAAMASNAGLPRAAADIPALKRALAEAGYRGERLVMLAAAEIPRISAVSEVMRDALVQIGLNVDFVQADWGTITARITNRQPVTAGGWSCYCTYVGGMDALSPATHSMMLGNGLRGPAGWSSSTRIEALRAQWFQAPDLAAQQALARDLQLAAFQDVPFVPLGQFIQPVAYRRSLTGMLQGAPVLTNIRKG